MTMTTMKEILGKRGPSPDAYMVAIVGEGPSKPALSHILRWEEMLDCDVQLLEDVASLKDPAMFIGAHHPTLYFLCGPVAGVDMVDWFDVAFYEHPFTPEDVPIGKVDLGPCSVEDSLIGQLVLPKVHIRSALTGSACDVLLVIGAIHPDQQPRLVCALNNLIERDSIGFVVRAAGWPELAIDGPEYMDVPTPMMKNDVTQMWAVLNQFPKRVNTVMFIGDFAFEDDAWEMTTDTTALECIYDARAWACLRGAAPPLPHRVCMDAAAALEAFIAA